MAQDREYNYDRDDCRPGMYGGEDRLIGEHKRGEGKTARELRAIGDKLAGEHDANLERWSRERYELLDAVAADLLSVVRQNLERDRRLVILEAKIAELEAERDAWATAIANQAMAATVAIIKLGERVDRLERRAAAPAVDLAFWVNP